MGNGKKTLAKALAMLMAATSLFSIAGCEDPNKDKTVILVKNFGGGVGRAWLDNAIKDFKDHIGDKQYEEGKTGIVFEITSNTSVKSDGMQTDGTHLYFLQEKYSNLYTLIQADAVLEITDIVRDQTLDEYGETGVTIESKINEDYRFAMQGTGNYANKYYMLPHYETQSGASYDVDMFDEMGFYLAKTQTFSSFSSELVGETFYFTDMPSEKTVGNDGIAGTDDDGMPTTLNELVAMCEYIKSNNVWPFSAPGGHIDYANYLIEGLWTALAGYEQRAAVTTLSGEVDYVTGVSSEDLWKGTGIKKPITEKAQVTVETGYKAINQAGRYYAFAFMQLAENQGWFYDRFLDTDYNHKAAMRSFILNGYGDYDKIAAHVEGSYWYNEAEGYGLFNDYKTYSGGKEIKNIGHWHMPTAVGTDTNGDGVIDTPAEVVTGVENKREETAMNNMTATCLINGNIDDRPGNEGKIQLCKDFLKFLYTEENLKKFSATTGVTKALMDYEVMSDEVLNELDPYQKTIMNLRANNRVVNQYGNNDMYRNYSTVLVYSANSAGYVPTIGTTKYSSILEVFGKRSDEYDNAWKMFTELGQNDGSWAEMLSAIR